MTATTPPTADRLEILTRLLAAATYEASAAMSAWTGGRIRMRLDEVRELPMEQVSSEFALGDDRLTMIVLPMDGELGGDMLLCFDDVHGRQLAATLLGRTKPETSDEWSELEQSALMETGNILACAYLNALTRLVGVKLAPLPPYFVQDYGASVLQQALMGQAAVADQALICRTCFERQGQDLQWSVFFVPSPALRERMEQALDTVAVN